MCFHGMLDASLMRCGYQNANATVAADKESILSLLAEGDVDYQTSEHIESLNQDVREAMVRL